MKILITIAGVLGVLVILGLLYIYSGVFNVAASDPHSALERWVLDTTMKKSVKSRAEDVVLPAYDLSTRVNAGFRHYHEMCVPCHGAPGKERSEMGKGLRPIPPKLSEEAEHWKPNELFWITKHGIKMTGMPAWCETHNNQELWDIVAFVEKLPTLSAEDYRVMEQGLAEQEVHEHTH